MTPTPSEDDDVVLGFKKITGDNITRLDITRAFGNWSDAEWVALFDRPQLDQIVPEPVRRLFELARGTMIYGRYYYPLLTLGYAECGRTLEAAARHAAHLVGVAKEPERQQAKYIELIDRLCTNGLINSDEREKWDLGRQLRNMFAHATKPTILPPGHASAKLRLAAEQINALFNKVADLGQFENQ